MKFISIKSFIRSFLISYILFFNFIYFEILANPNITEKINKDLKEIPQNCLNFINQKENLNKPIIEYNLHALKKNYIKRYFAPWDSPFSIISKKDLKEFLKKRIKRIRENPGWGFNKQPLTSKWVEKIIYKINLNEFPNINKKGIIIRNTYLRSLPCITPHFKDWTTPGQGYPFDNFQLSYLHAFQPIYILHKNKDKDWSFIITNQYSVGWIQTKDIAFVNETFIKKWRINNYIIPIKDDEAIYNKKYNKFLINSRIGQLLPLLKERKNNYEILTCKCEENEYAKIQTSKISNKATVKFPLILTELNIAKQMNTLIGKPYGWGGLYGFRDCTELLRDIFSVFGLFLPRNSKWQNEAGSKIYLEKFKNKEKANIIIKRGIPFLTLLYSPGHIILYIGEKNGIPYAYNTIWGLKTKTFFHSEDRAIIGKTLIMPLNIGDNYKTITKTPLDKITSIVLLNDNLTYPKLFEEQIYSGINQLDLIEEGAWKSKIDDKILRNKKINSLFKAYKKYIDNIASIKTKNKVNITFYMKDKTKILWENKNSISNKEINNYDLKDSLSEKYIIRYPINSPKPYKNPGQKKNKAFFDSIYGKSLNQIKNNLVRIAWMPKTNKNSIFIYFNRNAGAASALIRISHQLDNLSEDLKKYIKYIEVNIDHLSYGISLNLSKKYQNTFNDFKNYKYLNRIPEEIIKIFEENDFIWGGRWYHYNISYFEYRPEFFR